MNESEEIKTPSTPEGAPAVAEPVADAPQTAKKGKGGNSKDSGMSRLKALWRGTWSEEQKKYWSEQLTVGAKTLKSMREELRKHHQIDFTADKQMARFRDWIQDEQQWFEHTEEMKDYERRLEEEFPNATKDEIRDKLLKRTYAKIFSEGDFRLFFKAAHTDVKIDTLNLNREKFKESLRSKINAGIDMLAAEASKNPVVKAAVDQLRAALVPE